MNKNQIQIYKLIKINTSINKQKYEEQHSPLSKLKVEKKI